MYWDYYCMIDCMYLYVCFVGTVKLNVLYD